MFTVVKIILHNFRLLKKLKIIFRTFQVDTNSIESLFLYNFFQNSAVVFSLSQECCKVILLISVALTVWMVPLPAGELKDFYSSLPFLSAIIIENNNLQMQVFYPRLHMISTLYDRSEVHSLKLPLCSVTGFNLYYADHKITIKYLTALTLHWWNRHCN